jgi:hypothetical protein
VDRESVEGNFIKTALLRTTCGRKQSRKFSMFTGSKGCRVISTYMSISISDVVIGFFSRPNPSSRTMALRSTQSLTEMSTSNLPGSKGLEARKPDNLTAICEPVVYMMWQFQCFTISWTSYRDSFTFFSFYLCSNVISDRMIDTGKMRKEVVGVESK